MTRYKATPNGNVPFTPAEETEWDAMEAAWTAGADDRAAEAVRVKRDELLVKTDFYALSDVTMSPEMTTYRQALRDIPSQSGFPNTVTWPDEV